MQIDTLTNPSGEVSNTAGTIAFWPPEAITNTRSVERSSSICRENDLRVPEHSLDDLPPLHTSQEDDVIDLESLPPMMESYDNDDLDILPPMTMTQSHDLSEFPSMDLDTLPPINSSQSHDMNSLPPLNQVSSPIMSMTNDTVLTYSSYGADVWAAGVTMHCFLFGTLAISIEGSNPVDILSKITDYQPPTSFSATNNSSSAKEKGDTRYSSRPWGANEVWSKLLTKDPLCRMTTTEAFETTWLSAEADRREAKST